VVYGISTEIFPRFSLSMVLKSPVIMWTSGLNLNGELWHERVKRFSFHVINTEILQKSFIGIDFKVLNYRNFCRSQIILHLC
jgi:hypothetical protein